ncbi:hypothetical protein D3C77_642450 [compost metagenome]
MKTVSEAREAVEKAHYAYITCENVKGELGQAKESLDNARHDYHRACATFCEKIEFAKDLADVHHELIKQGLWK